MTDAGWKTPWDYYSTIKTANLHKKQFVSCFSQIYTSTFTINYLWVTIQKFGVDVQRHDKEWWKKQRILI